MQNALEKFELTIENLQRGGSGRQISPPDQMQQLKFPAIVPLEPAGRAENRHE